MSLRLIKYLVITIIVLVIGLYLIPFPQKSFFELYSEDDDFAKQLQSLRDEPLKTVDVDGVKWQYYSGGKGEKCILFIHGMGGSYDFWWNQIYAFQSDYKIISYTLPSEINSLKDVEKGILTILKQENIDKFIPVGTSMGGYITQYLMTKHPERVEKAVLGNTFPPNDFITKSNAEKRKLILVLPEYIVGKISQSHLKKDIFPTSENNKLLEAFLLSVPFSKKSLIGRYDVVTDYFTATPEKPEVKAIPKLIFESDNDPMITPKLRTEIKALYPDAQVHTFHNKGHFPYINAVEEYNETLKSFLEN